MGVVLVGVVLEVVAIMVEDMGIWVGGVATLTLTTNHDTKDPYAFQKKHMNDYGEEWPICLETGDVSQVPARLLEECLFRIPIFLL